MQSITEKIQSIRTTVGVDYVKPSKELLSSMVESLWTNEKALTYLRAERGFADDTIKHFNLGYSNDKNAIAIPITKNGELINIKYRLIDPKDKPKYLSTSGAETWIFNEDGIQHGKKKGRVLIVEGEFDAMMAWQNGSKSVVSPAAGKDSYGIWLELIDSIPLVYIAYDNDEPGKETAQKLADRIGIEKCLQVGLPEGIKDINEFFLKNTKEKFFECVQNARPFYRFKFKNIGDIINNIRKAEDTTIQSEFLPKIGLRDGWLAIVSGKSNVGKTTYILNIAEDLSRQGIASLILPFERGIDSVGERFLHVHLNRSPEDLRLMSQQDWEVVLGATADLPLYFAMPKREEVVGLIQQAKRILNVRVVIVDHLDYMVRQSRGNKEQDISNTLQEFKRVAEELGVVLIIVTHIRKVDGHGFTAKVGRPGIEDLKGSSSLYQDPEVVVMLSETEYKEEILVDVVKNKGEMSSKTFRMVPATGKYEREYKKVEKDERPIENKEAALLWESID